MRELEDGLDKSIEGVFYALHERAVLAGYVVWAEMLDEAVADWRVRLEAAPNMHPYHAAIDATLAHSAAGPGGVLLHAWLTCLETLQHPSLRLPHLPDEVLPALGWWSPRMRNRFLAVDLTLFELLPEEDEHIRSAVASLLVPDASPWEDPIVESDEAGAEEDVTALCGLLGATEASLETLTRYNDVRGVSSSGTIHTGGRRGEDGSTKAKKRSQMDLRLIADVTRAVASLLSEVRKGMFG